MRAPRFTKAYYSQFGYARMKCGVTDDECLIDTLTINCVGYICWANYA